MSDAPEIDRDCFVALARAGAEQSALAFGQLVGETIRAAAPVVVEAPAPLREDAPPSGDPAATGVFFELEGCLDALVGIVFPGDTSEQLVRRVVGLEDGPLEPPVFESALMEVGNILASHVASAIADRLAARLLPSIPSLAMADADTAFEAFLEGRIGPEVMRVESRLSAGSGGLGGRLVLVPSR